MCRPASRGTQHTYYIDKTERGGSGTISIVKDKIRRGNRNAEAASVMMLGGVGLSGSWVHNILCCCRW